MEDEDLADTMVKAISKVPEPSTPPVFFCGDCGTRIEGPVCVVCGQVFFK